MKLGLTCRICQKKSGKHLSEQKRGSRCLWSCSLAAGWFILVTLAGHQAAPEDAEISRSTKVVLTNEKNEIHLLPTLLCFHDTKWIGALRATSRSYLLHLKTTWESHGVPATLWSPDTCKSARPWAGFCVVSCQSHPVSHDIPLITFQSAVSEMSAAPRGTANWHCLLTVGACAVVQHYKTSSIISAGQDRIGFSL